MAFGLGGFAKLMDLGVHHLEFGIVQGICLDIDVRAELLCRFVFCWVHFDLTQLRLLTVKTL